MGINKTGMPGPGKTGQRFFRARHGEDPVCALVVEPVESRQDRGMIDAALCRDLRDKAPDRCVDDFLMNLLRLEKHAGFSAGFLHGGHDGRVGIYKRAVHIPDKCKMFHFAITLSAM